MRVELKGSGFRIKVNEERLVRKISLDWLNFPPGNATSPMHHLFGLINSHLMHNPWKMRPWSHDAM
jgi:hypothetical protein